MSGLRLTDGGGLQVAESTGGPLSGQVEHTKQALRTAEDSARVESDRLRGEPDAAPRLQFRTKSTVISNVFGLTAGCSVVTSATVATDWRLSILEFVTA